MLMGIGWRIRRFLNSYRYLYRLPFHEITRQVSNTFRKNDFAYIYAEPLNAGDFASYKGIRFLSGLSGAEYYGSKDFLKATINKLHHSCDKHARYKALFIGGGGLFHDAFNSLWDMLIDVNIPLVVFGVGINNYQCLRKPSSQDLIRRIYERSIYFRVRDNATANYVENATGFRPSVGICPAVNYLHNLKSVSQHNFSRKATHLLHVYHEADILNSSVSFTELRERIMHISRMMNLCYDETNHINGLSQNLINRYNRAALVVSSRLHGCIFALALSIPFIALSIDEKISYFIETHLPDAIHLKEEDILGNISYNLFFMAMKYKYNNSIINKMINENVHEMKHIIKLLQ
ncbi:MAG: polysaccharide pyruvyl transferase family protein [Clostridiales bacterium]|nr:polysaccharide pyruvyl transferase family protein [Clostridiales bacterium]